MTPDKLSLLSFTRFLKADWSSSDHTSLTQHLFCKKFVRELWKDMTREFDHRGNCVRSSIPPYAEMNPGKCEAVTPMVFAGSECGWEETSLYS